jgi:hypothetical protein
VLFGEAYPTTGRAEIYVYNNGRMMTSSGQQKTLEKKLPQCHLIHHESHRKLPKTEGRLSSEKPASSRRPSYDTAIARIITIQKRI